MTPIQCRFCLEEDDEKNLISPCLCKGTFQQIHNKCLQGWQKHEPQKALRCSVCLELFSRTYEQPLEMLPFYEFQRWIWLRNPALIIVLNHWIYWCVLSGLWEETILLSPIERYITFQSLFHIWVWKYACDLLSNVKNPRRQWLQWGYTPRVFLVCFQVFTFLSIPQTFWVGGMASDFLLFYFFLEHYEILVSLNCQEKFRFTSRLVLPSCDEPQSASSVEEQPLPQEQQH